MPFVAWKEKQPPDSRHYMSKNVAEAARNDGDPIQAIPGGVVGASGESPTVPGQFGLDSPVSPQAQQQVLGTVTTTTTQSQGTKREGIRTLVER